MPLNGMRNKPFGPDSRLDRSNHPLPILYSFLRCPYAIRARLALQFADQRVYLREVQLKAKPTHMLAISPKGTVPVLLFDNDTVLEESRDIMQWALQRNDPLGLLNANKLEVEALLDDNDFQFKKHLDRYKYPDRYSSEPTENVGRFARDKAEAYLQSLEIRLQQHAFVLTDSLTVADIGLFPFVRQFAKVDSDWFTAAPYPALHRWLKTCMALEQFETSMQKQSAWQEGSTDLVF